MKRDFKKEYEEYMEKKTPDLWDRIEKGLDEPAAQEKQTGGAPKKPSNKIVMFRRLIPAAACVCILAAGVGVMRLRDDASKNPGLSDAGSTAAVQEKEKTEEKQTAKADSAMEEIENKAAESDAGALTAVENSPAAGVDDAGNSEAAGAADTGSPEAAGAGDAAVLSEDAAPAEDGAVSTDDAMVMPENTPEPEPLTEDVRKDEELVLFEESNAPAYQDKNYQLADGAAFEAAETEMASSAEMAFEDSGTSPLAMTGSTGVIPDMQYSRETYEQKEENSFLLVQEEPLSTFSADVDTASYANVRRMIEDGFDLSWIDTSAVRPEEFINYFNYDLKKPEAGEKFGVTTEIGPCPWNEKHQLLMIGVTTEDIDLSEAPAENLTFLVDVSGSMSDADKLPLLQKSFLQLVEELDEEDTVSIVTYANGVEIVLNSVKGSDKAAIRQAIDGLTAGGGTYGEDGIQKAYALAEDNFDPEKNNRIILATDGDLNIGISDPDELEKLITEKKESGIYLSVLGFGTGNIRDDNMERLADCGNGNYAYIDSLLEAKKVLVEEMGSSLHVVAEDVKFQVEFNPERVSSYRLIGYENRLMAAQDFRDDSKDAGEIGAGHSVIALYELIPAGSEEAISLKYQKKEEEKEEEPSEYADEFCEVHIRYKEPGEKTAADELVYPVDESCVTEEPDENLFFASLAAEFALVLSDSENKGTATLEGIMDAYKAFYGDAGSTDEYKSEFYYLVRLLSKNS